LLDKLAADLELRDDQKVRMEELLGGIERRQFGLLREARQGAITTEELPARIEALRGETLGTARAFLDPAQSDLFEERAQRYFDGLLLRATRGEGKSPAPAAPAPQTPPAPKPGE
jgi:hypothetical protein